MTKFKTLTNPFILKIKILLAYIKYFIKRNSTIFIHSIHNLLSRSKILSKHISISVLAVAFVSSEFISTSSNNIKLNTLFLPDPSVITQIVKSIEPYTPVLSESNIDISLTLVDSNKTDYVQQASILAMSSDNPYDGYAIKYAVQQGDTWSGVASKFNLKTGSVLASNGYDAAKLKKDPYLRIGQELVIPAEDVGSFTEWVQIYNDIQTAKRQEVAQRNTSSRSTTSRTSSGSKNVSVSSGLDFTSRNGYPGGWCTAGVIKFRPDVSHGWGNAGNWYRAAAAEGRSVGKIPRAGAIIVTGESGWGHVAYVASVSGDIVKLIDMNYVGRGRYSERTVNYHSIPTRGFIY